MKFTLQHLIYEEEQLDLPLIQSPESEEDMIPAPSTQYACSVDDTILSPEKNPVQISERITLAEIISLPSQGKFPDVRVGFKQPKVALKPHHFKDAFGGYLCEIALYHAVFGNVDNIEQNLKQLETNDPKEINFSATKFLNLFDPANSLNSKCLPSAKLVYSNLLKNRQDLEYLNNVYTFYLRSTDLCNDALDSKKVSDPPLREYIKNNGVVGQKKSTDPYDFETTSNLVIHVKLNQSFEDERIASLSNKDNKGNKGNEGNEGISTNPIVGFRDKIENWQKTIFADANGSGRKALFAELMSELTQRAATNKIAIPEAKKLAFVEFLLSSFIKESNGRLVGSDYIRKIRKEGGKIQVPNSLSITAETLGLWWNLFRNAYQCKWNEHFKYATTKGDLVAIQQPLLEDVYEILTGQSYSKPKAPTKKVVWFLFSRIHNDVEPSLTVKTFNLSQPQNNETKESYYLHTGYYSFQGKVRAVVYLSTNKQGSEDDLKNLSLHLATVEIRTDGNDHPPQLKIGAGLSAHLDELHPAIKSLYNEITFTR